MVGAGLEEAMNIGAILLIIYLFSRFFKNKDTTGSASTWAGQETSSRTITVSVLTVLLFFIVTYVIMVNCQPYLDQINSGWLRDIAWFIVYLVIPITLLRCVPPWLAWRVLRHLGHSLPARIIFWFTPGEAQTDLIGFARLVEASLGHDPNALKPPPSPLSRRLRIFFMLGEQQPEGDLDAWTVAADALYAEISGDSHKAAQYILSFNLLPRRSQAPRLIRIFAFEQFALHAARRGAWGAVAGCAAFGAGRSMPLLRLLARGHLTGSCNRALLVLYWIIAPCRLATFPYLRSLLSPQPSSDTQEVTLSDETFQIAHLRLLQDAAEGRPIELVQVLSLAAAWQSTFTSESHAAILARGMAVGARDSHGVADAIPEEILAELEELVAVSVGGLPEELFENWDEWRETLVGTLVIRLRSRLFQNLEESAAQFFDSDAEQPPPLLQCWNTWLAMHDATERLGYLMGTEDVATAWYGGLQITAWNGACRVSNSYGSKGNWVSYLMFSWVVRVADIVEDAEAARVNRNNAATCGIPLYTTFESFLRLPLRLYKWFSGCLMRVCSFAWWGRETPRALLNIRSALLDRITIVLPVGGAVVAVSIFLSLWSFSDLVVGSLVGLPILVAGIALLYVLALRIEKKRQREATQMTLKKEVEETV
jgi:hypothetical protein